MDGAATASGMSQWLDYDGYRSVPRWRVRQNIGDPPAGTRALPGLSHVHADKLEPL